MGARIRKQSKRMDLSFPFPRPGRKSGAVHRRRRGRSGAAAHPAREEHNDPLSAFRGLLWGLLFVLLLDVGIGLVVAIGLLILRGWR
jgi:hypothetical protein